MKHTKTVKGLNIDNDVLANRVGDLYYDSLSEFLLLLSEKIKSDGDADRARGRVKLADNLCECAEKLKDASRATEKAWKICEPFVKAWEEKHS